MGDGVKGEKITRREGWQRKGPPASQKANQATQGGASDNQVTRQRNTSQGRRGNQGTSLFIFIDFSTSKLRAIPAGKKSIWNYFVIVFSHHLFSVCCYTARHRLVAGSPAGKREAAGGRVFCRYCFGLTLPTLPVVFLPPVAHGGGVSCFLIHSFPPSPS